MIKQSNLGHSLRPWTRRLYWLQWPVCGRRVELPGIARESLPAGEPLTIHANGPAQGATALSKRTHPLPIDYACNSRGALWVTRFCGNRDLIIKLNANKKRDSGKELRKVSHGKVSFGNLLFKHLHQLILLPLN